MTVNLLENEWYYYDKLNYNCPNLQSYNHSRDEGIDKLINLRN